MEYPRPHEHLPAATAGRAPAVEWRSISKTFGSQTAVDNLSLAIPAGSFYGIVGPNGAGKTTAITIATGLLRPDSGEAFVCGHNVWQADSATKAKQCFGLLADGLPVFDRLTGREHLDYLGRLRGIDEATLVDRAESLLQILGLADAANKMIADYSAGMRKKILLAGAMLHRPQVLILDEPLEAVDPVSADTITRLLRRYVDSGGSVVISSHVMPVVEGLCDHVALIADGTVRRAGSMNDVCGQQSLAETFVGLVGGEVVDEQNLGWLQFDADHR